MNKNLETARGHSWMLTHDAVGLLGVVAMVALAFTVWELQESQHDAARIGNEEMLTARLTDVTRMNAAIRRISQGKPEEAKEFLNSTLAANLLELSASLPEEDEATRDFGSRICNKIVQAERAHPDEYLTQPQLSRPHSGGEWAALGPDPFGPPTPERAPAGADGIR